MPFETFLIVVMTPTSNKHIQTSAEIHGRFTSPAFQYAFHEYKIISRTHISGGLQSLGFQWMFPADQQILIHRKAILDNTKQCLYAVGLHATHELEKGIALSAPRFY